MERPTRQLTGAGGLLAAALVLVSAPVLGACSADPPGPAPTSPPAAVQTARDQLAGLAAAAKDRRYIATYTYTATHRAAATVTVAIATDGSWVVAVPGSGLSGLADLAVYHPGSTSQVASQSQPDPQLYQCLLGPAAGTAGARPDLGPLDPGCVRVTAISAGSDPRVQHIFTDWVDELRDRDTALSVTAADAPGGVSGSCFSVESTSAALTPPVDPGIYCYDPTGLLTAARVGFGSLDLVGAAAPAPPSVAQPAPLVSRAPVPVTAPPAPSNTAGSATATVRP